VTASTSRRDKRHQETREEVLRAARRLVKHRGAENLTMREIARGTYLSAPALYRYFEGGKEEIILALARQDLDHIATHLRKVPGDLPPDERLVELGLAYLDFARRHPDEFDLLLDNLSAVGSLDVETGMQSLALSPLLGIIDGAIREGIAAGMLQARTEDDVMLMWHGAWALVHGLVAVERTNEHHDKLFSARARDILRAFVNGLKTDWTSG
jgi:AcrR family transcriptional regulator